MLEARSLGDSPSVPALWLSFSLHLACFAVFFAVRHEPHPRIVPETYQNAELLRGAKRLFLHPNYPNPDQSHVDFAKRPPRRARTAKQEPTDGGEGGQSLRQRAERETAAMMTSFKLRATYGFAPGHQYQTASRISGQTPSISAEQLPLHFEQYLVIELTIDTEGHVAEAHIVTGSVESTIEQTLLSAVREFKYAPAKRDGIPIPSQLDIVIHIPT
ncbi:MAG TPA: energy transducer TonB [Candidatus Angelobacter sp.]|nr:energy transducer TonB [Candidatus Angelobacter sp.]